VIAEPNQRVRVATLSPADAEELFTMRIPLEVVALRITVPTLTSDDVAHLGATSRRWSTTRSQATSSGSGRHRAFHRTLVAAAGARVTAGIAELGDHSERYRLRFGGSVRWEDRRGEHRAILDAAAAGDVDRAAARLAAHYAHAAALVFEGLDPRRDLTRLRTAIRAVAPGAEAALVTAC